MSASDAYLGESGCNIDVHRSLLTSDKALFSKNTVYGSDPANIGNGQGAKQGVRKTMESNVEIPGITMPEGYCQKVGGRAFPEINKVFVCIYNENGNHFVYQINGVDQSVQIVYQSSALNFQLDPQYFIGEGQMSIQITYVSDPITGQQRQRTYLQITDGFNPQRQFCVEDSLATSSFSSSMFPYFNGTYDPALWINMGLPTPMDCIDVVEIPRTQIDLSLPNNVLFNTWQFRIKGTDVYGRPTEHGIISRIYVPGINDCLSASNNLPRCVILIFGALTPIIDNIQIEWRNCNNEQWYIDDVIFLYEGSALGDWWLRPRNENGGFTYNASDNTISYIFCRTKECNPAPTTETNRLFNPLPITSNGVADIAGQTTLTNNKSGQNPFTQMLLSKITGTVIPPISAPIQTRKITIYCPIWNPFLRGFQQVFKDGTKGYSYGDNDAKHSGASNYQQTFKNTSQSGFGGYLVGTGNFVISTQYYLDGSGNLVQDTDFDGLSSSPRLLSFQKFEFTNVPPGSYIFTIFSQLVDPTIATNPFATSTPLWGVCPFNGNTFFTGVDGRITSKELLINVCNEDYNTLTQPDILVIADLAAFKNTSIGPISTGGQQSKVTYGYIYETEENGTNQFPVELMRVMNAQPNQVNSLITDRNGFFYFGIIGVGHDTYFSYSNECAPAQFTISEGNTGAPPYPRYIYLDQVNSIGQNATTNPLSPQYPSCDCNRTLIKGQILLQGSGIGVANTVVALTRGGLATTDDNGNFTLIAHDDVTSGTIGTRLDTLIMVPGGCNYTAVGGGCIPNIAVTIVPCSSCNCKTPRVITEPTITIVALVQRGLLSAGTYAVGCVGWDGNVSRCGFVQSIGYITIPSIPESKAIAPSQVQINIAADAIFPTWVSQLSFFISAELTTEAYIDWIVDRVEFIDNTGNINLDAPTQIRIYYASIIEYNKQNNFNTTDQWQFLAPAVQAGAAQVPYTSDRVMFFVNGDGTFYFSTEAANAIPLLPPTLISALVKYDQTGQYFLIDYNSSLDNLQQNALIRLMRPTQCSNTETTPMYEVCGSVIPIQDNVAIINQFILDAFDTYYISRTIPVPTPLNSTTPLNATSVTTQTTTTDVSPGVVDQTIVAIPNEVTADEQRSFGFPFEHNSPSNFWGQGCWNQGRINTKNPYESQIYESLQIALSGEITSTAQANFLNYFDNAKKTDISPVNFNEITAILPETTTILVIGDTDWCVVGYSDNEVRVNAQGIAEAPSIDNAFGNPGGKIGSNYGCQQQDRLTISKYQGVVMYLDTVHAALIRHNYREATAVNIGIFDSYLTPKIKFVQQWNVANPTQQRYFVGAINKINSEYLLTDFLIGGNNFVNNERHYILNDNDTISVDTRNGMFKGWYGYTAEGYASLEGAAQQQQLFAFKNGVAYAHYSVSDNRTYGTFFGVTVNRVFRVVMSMDNLKKKKALFAQVYSHHAWFMSRVETETGQISRTLLHYARKANWFWQLPFLCAENTLPDPYNVPATTENALLDGDNLIGNWIDATFVGKPEDDTTYTELQGVTIAVFGSEKSGT